MKAHDFARKLLAGPDLPIFVPKAIEWDDSEDCCAEPFVTQEGGEHRETGAPCQILVISYRFDNRFAAESSSPESKIENRDPKFPVPPPTQSPVPGVSI